MKTKLLAVLKKASCFSWATVPKFLLRKIRHLKVGLSKEKIIGGFRNPVSVEILLITEVFLCQV